MEDFKSKIPMSLLQLCHGEAVGYANMTRGSDAVAAHILGTDGVPRMGVQPLCIVRPVRLHMDPKPEG